MEQKDRMRKVLMNFNPKFPERAAKIKMVGVHGDDPERCYGEGGGRGVHVWECM